MKRLSVLLFALLVLLPSCSSPPTPVPEAPPPPPLPEVGPLGEMAVPADNPMTPEKVALGKQLFFDTRLSKTGMMSCETCHLPEKGWADGNALSARFDGSMNTRHTPTLINVGFYKQYYWDGRAPTLEAQILAAWRGQMGADPDAIAAALNAIEGYKTAFQKVMGGPASAQNIPQAIAAFVRTIKSENAPWDAYEKGDKSAVSDDAVKGFNIFSADNKANCTLCHLPPLYSDTLFHNTGIGTDKPNPDPGRGKILADAAQQKGTPDPEARKMVGAFKTPTLRGVTENAPYFHDGRAQTLEEAVDLMLNGGIRNANVDEKLKKRSVTPAEKAQLMAFLKSLTPEPKPFEKPKLP